MRDSRAAVRGHGGSPNGMLSAVIRIVTQTDCSPRGACCIALARIVAACPVQWIAHMLAKFSRQSLGHFGRIE